MDDLLDLDFPSASSPGSKPLSPQRPTGSKASSFDLLSRSNAGAGGVNYYSSTSTSSASTPAPIATPTPRLQTPSSFGIASASASASTSTSTATGIPRYGNHTPNTAPLPHSARLGIPDRPSSGSSLRGSGPSPNPNTNARKTIAKTDAFEDLLALGGGPVGGSNSNAGLSLADRQARAERERLEREERERKQFDFEQGEFWSKFGHGPGDNGLSPVPAPTLAPARSPAPMIAPKPLLAAQSGSKGKGTFWDSDFLSTPGDAQVQSRDAVSPVERVGSSVKPQPNQQTQPTLLNSTTNGPRGPVDPWDFDELATSVPGGKGTSQWGVMPDEEEDGLFGGGGSGGVVSNGGRGNGHGHGHGRGHEYGTGDSDDDLLGELGKPVQRAVPKNDRRDDAPKATQSAARPTRASSPPPHIVGQIVEMGFTPAQARSALASTRDGMDVQAALEGLLGGSSAGDAEGARNGNGNGHGNAQNARESRFDDGVSDDEEMIARERARREEEERERRRARRAGPSRDSVQPRNRDEREREQTQGDYRDEAEKYLQQASAIGSTVLGKATSFWAASKERAQKLYEEQKRNYEAQQRQQQEENGGSGSGGRVGATRVQKDDGRPKWMIRDENYEAGPGEEPAGGFRDDDDSSDEERAAPISTSNARAREGGQVRVDLAEGSAQRDRAPDAYRSVKERTDLLFAEEPKAYVSAHRRKIQSRETGPGTGSGKQVPPLSVSASRTPRAVTPITPVALAQRQLVDASPSAIAAALKSKATGNEHFKLGRFAESETAYTSAISKLPPGHIHLVALYNNRATTRLKLGQADGVVEDCSAVLEILGMGYHPSKEAPLPSEYADVRLAEGLLKALTKRAQAREMSEKWTAALEDWERAMGLSADPAFGQIGAGMRDVAVEGARRARRMLAPPSQSPSQSQSSESTSGAKATVTNLTKPHGNGRPRAPPASSRITTETSTAVSSLRAANSAAEKEGAERMELKDKVDARVTSWKGGKETNLRALIASLDQVLWDGMMRLPGMKVGMHELISEKQVKIRYMKVVARLHPDKLSVSETTVEQRMLANGAFGALSEAWAAFQNA